MILMFLEKFKKGGKNVPVPLCIGDKHEINSRTYGNDFDAGKSLTRAMVRGGP
jgi:hypothetical protein